MEEYFGFAPDQIPQEKSNGKSPGPKHFKKKFGKNPEEKIAIRKEIRKKKQERKKRLIVRNLSFKVNEEELRKEFSKFGDVVDVNIPKKPDGKLRGFAFVQYKSFQSAIEAVRNLNYKKLKGRPIAVDYAVAKDKFQHITSSKHTSNNPSRKPEDDDSKKLNKDDDSEGEKTDSDDDGGSDNMSDVGEKSKEESVSEAVEDHVEKFLKEFNADQESLQSAADESEESCSESDSSSESDDSSHFKKSQSVKEEEEEEDDDDDMDSGSETGAIKKRKASDVSDQEPLQKKKNHSDDINEKKTIFVRNVSFDTDQDALKRTMETFGPVKYCLLVIDKFTELPRGTAFVKFENKEDAEKVIEKSSESDSEGIYLDGRKLCCVLAVSRGELESNRETGAKTRKDKRNLRLLNVGVIMKDSEEAEGVSQSDLTKRAKLEMVKRNKLKNLQFFVSDKRLCVHNIPSYYSDAELQKLFKNAAGPRAKITETRILRNFKKVNAQGIAESKGFGFVAFEKHDDALKALKIINNNPNVFTPQQRPIVEFSVENTNALLMKKRRKERSSFKTKKDSENPEVIQTEEESMASWKFNKKSNVNKKNMWYGKKRQGEFNSNKNSQKWKSNLKKGKMENNFNRERKQQGFMSKQQSNNRSMKENPEKKKNKRQKKKNRLSSEGSGKNNFNQMVDKYKQNLLSSM